MPAVSDLSRACEQRSRETAPATPLAAMLNRSCLESLTSIMFKMPKTPKATARSTVSNNAHLSPEAFSDGVEPRRSPRLEAKRIARELRKDADLLPSVENTPTRSRKDSTISVPHDSSLQKKTSKSEISCHYDIGELQNVSGDDSDVETISELESLEEDCSDKDSTYCPEDSSHGSSEDYSDDCSDYSDERSGDLVNQGFDDQVDDCSDDEVMMSDSNISQTRRKRYDHTSHKFVDIPPVVCEESNGTRMAFLAESSPSRAHRRRTQTPDRQISRAARASTTLYADSSYEHSVVINASKVRDVIIDKLQHGDWRDLDKEGFVYAFRDHELGLVKIGFTGDLRRRKSQIQSTCKMSSPMVHVADSGLVPAYRALEAILHQDLAPLRWVFLCDCKQLKKESPKSRTKSHSAPYTKHQEYFEINDDDVKKIIRFWSGFVASHPWKSRLNRNPCFGLKAMTNFQSDWLHLFSPDKGVLPPRYEGQHEHHDYRLIQWRKILGLKCDKAKTSGDEEPSAASLVRHKRARGVRRTTIDSTLCVSMNGLTINVDQR
ncbi:hypothetical protein D6D17_01202 [Aureobasidium pullulans]|nr:hypothetical protein D6D17_01202 [Aureobasidium pullulans]